MPPCPGDRRFVAQFAHRASGSWGVRVQSAHVLAIEVDVARRRRFWIFRARFKVTYRDKRPPHRLSRGCRLDRLRSSATALSDAVLSGREVSRSSDARAEHVCLEVVDLQPLSPTGRPPFGITVESELRCRGGGAEKTSTTHRRCEGDPCQRRPPRRYDWRNFTTPEQESENRKRCRCCFPRSARTIAHAAGEGRTIAAAPYDRLSSLAPAASNRRWSGP